MKNIDLTGCIAATVFIVGFTASSGGEKASPRVVADQIVDQLHPMLAQRFGSLTNDRFGISRAPRRYHIQGGVINPAPLKAYEEKAGANFKPFGTAELPTDQENKLIDQMKDAWYDFEVYTVGLPNADGMSRLRGPVGATRFRDEDEPKRDEVKKVGNGVNTLGAKDSADSASPDGRVYFKAKSIRMSEEKCANCHPGVKVGEKVGAIVYRYWPRG